jgi:KDO2-lipid IV(A) lauroyltransferase
VGRALARPPLRKRVKRRLRYLVLRAALALLSRLSWARAGRLGEALGGLGYRLAGAQRRRALSSLATAFPEKSPAEREALARAAFRHLGRALLELACVGELDRDPDRFIDWPKADREALATALGRGLGVVFITGHVGNWELLARRVALAGFPAQSIAREASDPDTTALVEGFRLRGGVRSIWRGQPGAARQMLRALKAGEILGLVIDQDTKVQSVFVPFFGTLAATPRAPADLVLRTGAALMVGFCQRQADGRYLLTMKELPVAPTGDGEADAVALTAQLSGEIEAAIRRHPEQWVWMHPRWKTRPPEPGRD